MIQKALVTQADCKLVVLRYFFFLCHGLTKYSDIVLHFNIISEVGALTISRD